MATCRRVQEVEPLTQEQQTYALELEQEVDPLTHQQQAQALEFHMANKEGSLVLIPQGRPYKTS